MIFHRKLVKIKGSFLKEVVICSIKPIINEVETVDEVKS